MATPTGRTFYRVLAKSEAIVDDFLSGEAAGDDPPENATAELLRMWRGISVYRTETQARNKAKALRLGDFIAQIEVPVGSSITFDRTGGRNARGHHTLWGDPEEIMRCVTRIIPVHDSPAADRTPR